MSVGSPGPRKPFAGERIDAGIATGAPAADEDRRQDLKDNSDSPISESMAGQTGASTIVRDISGDRRLEIAALQTDDHYRLLFECNPVPMWVFDRDTLRFLAANEAAIRQYGFTRQEFLARTILEIRPEEDVADVLTDVARRSPGLQERGFWRHRRKNGELIDVEIVCHPLDFQGTESMMVSAYDITARQLAEAATRQAEEKYRGMFEDAVIGIFQATVDGRLVNANRAFAQMHGFDSPEQMLAELEGKTMGLAVDPSGTAECAEIVAKQGALRGAEVEVNCRDGSRKWLRLSIREVRDASKNVVLHEGTTEDITDQRRAVEAVREAEEKYRAIFDDAVVGIFQTTPDGRPLSINRAMAELHGYDSPEELIATVPNVAQQLFVNPGRLLELGQILAEKGVVYGEEVELYRKDGTRKWVRVNLRALRDGRGSVVRHEGTAEDISEQKLATEQLEDSKNRYRVLFEDSGDAALVTDETGILDCNSAALEMFGYSSMAALPHPIDMSPPNQADGIPSRVAGKQKVAEARAKGKVSFEWLHQRKNGQIFPAEVSLTGLTLSGRQVVLAIVRDITERKQAEEALLFKTALLEAQTETTIDGILVVDESDRIVLANKQFGLSFEMPADLLVTGDARLTRQHMLEMVEGPEAFIEKTTRLNGNRTEKSMDELRLKNGKIFDRYSAPLVDANGRHRGRIWYMRDITERKAAEERIQFLAYYDALTELPQRALLEDRLEHALADARRRGEKIALLYLALDQFKAINDSFGHAFGDILLREVARRIQACGREQDTAARVGGDEFVILLSSAKGSADAAIAAERIMVALNGNFDIQGESLGVSCSIGVSMFPEHGADSESLIRNADEAMYRAKSDGRGKVRFFSNEMNAEAQERLRTDKDLRLAIDREEFFLEYQPQVEIETGRITGFEALIRWQHPELGLIPPDRFISIAENNGLIMPIGEWVLRTACAQARRWQDEGLAVVPVAVNVSAVQFRQEGFTALVRRVLIETGLSARSLELELTESLLLSDVEVVFATLQDLKRMGVRLAIDDFGTGYSSLSYLKKFPVDKLKIDRTFIRDIAADADDAAITTAIVSMAKNLRLNVIAEGVETEEQMSFLREHKCDEIQGYYFSRPLLPDDAASMLKSQTCLAHRDSAQEPGGRPFPSAGSFRRFPVSA